jgi:hypothetical protein
MATGALVVELLQIIKKQHAEQSPKIAIKTGVVVNGLSFLWQGIS